MKLVSRVITTVIAAGSISCLGAGTSMAEPAHQPFALGDSGLDGTFQERGFLNFRIEPVVDCLDGTIDISGETTDRAGKMSVRVTVSDTASVPHVEQSASVVHRVDPKFDQFVPGNTALLQPNTNQRFKFKVLPDSYTGILAVEVNDAEDDSSNWNTTIRTVVPSINSCFPSIM